ncbi:hypothetical protein [Clostridium merdae]|uniref:hypothetical protein n=1 Tax=Clostridium merdae TaxID=1958780 RepID=UPI000A26BFD7|nr:hypothetical protein [Clostridium merdae]
MSEGVFAILGAITGAVTSGTIGYYQQKYIAKRTVSMDIWKQKQVLFKEITNCLIDITKMDSETLNEKDAEYLTRALIGFSKFYTEHRGEFYLFFDPIYRTQINTLHSNIEEKLESEYFSSDACADIVFESKKLLENTRNDFNRLMESV